MLSHEELADAQRREEADRVRDDGRKHFAREVADRVDSLRDSVKGVKGDIMGEGSPVLLLCIHECSHFCLRWFDASVWDHQIHGEHP